MKWIGLTGGIATGKSTAKKLIEGLGYPVIDADMISHDITQVGREGYEKIVSHFGKQILQADQSLNRKALGQVIFNDAGQRLQLEQILHPLIQAEVQRQKEDHAVNQHKLCFYDVPLLFEKDLKKNFDFVVLVWCDPVMQKFRLMARNQLTEAEAESRLSSQTDMPFKIKNSHYCLDNSTDVHGLDKQVQRLVQTLVSA
jgi:dephospho-CoA kinase